MFESFEPPGDRCDAQTPARAASPLGLEDSDDAGVAHDWCAAPSAEAPIRIELHFDSIGLDPNHPSAQGQVVLRRVRRDAENVDARVEGNGRGWRGLEHPRALGRRIQGEYGEVIAQAPMT